jgi:hypothetical protein
VYVRKWLEENLGTDRASEVGFKGGQDCRQHCSKQISLGITYADTYFLVMVGICLELVYLLHPLYILVPMQANNMCAYRCGVRLLI